AALSGNEPPPYRAELSPDPERHLLTDDQRLRLYRIGGRLAGGRGDRAAPDRAACPGALPEHQVRGPAPRRDHPDAAAAPRQSGAPEAPEPSGAPERHRAPLLLRHRRSRLAGRAALRLEGVRRRSVGGRQRLSRPARVRELSAELLLSARVDPAAGGCRQDPAPQRADRAGAPALVARGQRRASVAATSRACAAPRSANWLQSPV